MQQSTLHKESQILYAIVLIYKYFYFLLTSCSKVILHYLNESTLNKENQCPVWYMFITTYALLLSCSNVILNDLNESTLHKENHYCLIWYMFIITFMLYFYHASKPSWMIWRRVHSTK